MASTRGQHHQYIQSELKSNLKASENSQLKELTKKIGMEETNCPKELIQYLKYGEFFAITEKDRILTKSTEKVLTLLEAELGKQGKTLDWFLENHIGG